MNEKIGDIRFKIYRHLGVLHYTPAQRSRKIRQVCPFANGLDLRRRQDVIYLARQLLIENPYSSEFQEKQEEGVAV